MDLQKYFRRIFFFISIQLHYRVESKSFRSYITSVKRRGIVKMSETENSAGFFNSSGRFVYQVLFIVKFFVFIEARVQSDWTRIQFHIHQWKVIYFEITIFDWGKRKCVCCVHRTFFERISRILNQCQQRVCNMCNMCECMMCVSFDSAVYVIGLCVF